VAACEQMVDERFRFDVSLRLPLVGLLAHYRGWLKPDEMDAEAAVAPDLPPRMMTSGAAADRG